MQIAKYVIVLLLVSMVYTVQGQESYIQQSSSVDSLISLHKKINKIDSLVPGYRIQIFFESGNFSKKKALETAEEFKEAFPTENYYLSFNEPYYRIRVGDYRTMIEAKGFLTEILSDYPTAFVVKEMIYFPPLTH